MADRLYNVLFLCTGNTARSILAEGILRKDGAGRFNAFSAGSQPKGVVNPFALKVLDALGYPTDGYRSKSWNEFAEPGAPAMDFVFTVCDSAAGEACPVWPGQPMTAHWGIEDPGRRRRTRHREGARLRAGGQVPQEPDLGLPEPAAGLASTSCRSSSPARHRPHGGLDGPQAGGLSLDGRHHLPQPGLRHVAQHAGLIRNAGVEPHVIEYLKTPPTRALLEQLIAAHGRLRCAALLREKGTPYAELGLADPSLDDDALLDAMMAHPILINRPIVRDAEGRAALPALGGGPRPPAAAAAASSSRRTASGSSTSTGGGCATA